MNLKTFNFFALLMCIISLLSCNDDKAKQNEANNKTTQPIGAVGNLTGENTSSLELDLRKDSLNIESRLILASNYYEAHNYDKALYHFMLVNKIDKKNIQALISIGNIYYDTNAHDKAVEYYEKALALDNNNLNVRCDLATSYSKIKQFEKAIKILKENIKIDNNHVQSHHNLAIILGESGNKNEAEKEMKIYETMVGAQK